MKCPISFCAMLDCDQLSPNAAEMNELGVVQMSSTLKMTVTMPYGYDH